MLAVMLTAVAWDAAATMRREPLTVVTATGQHRFEVEIAERQEDRSRGLMFRRSLGASEGMLFVYERPQPISMWMRNTYISLDMIFIAADGVVRRIERDTEPFSERTIPSGGPVLAVLEVIAGTSDRIGLKPGDRVVHGAFRR